MERISLTIVAALIFGTVGLANGQTVEMAAKCDAVYKTLSELVKRPDFNDVQQVKQSLGIDVLDTCDGPKGQITCFQCLDKGNVLRTLQLSKDKATGKFELLGYGCRCRDGK